MPSVVPSPRVYLGEDLCTELLDGASVPLQGPLRIEPAQIGRELIRRPKEPSRKMTYVASSVLQYTNNVHERRHVKQ